MTFTFSRCHPCSFSSLFLWFSIFFFFILSTDIIQNRSRWTSTEKRLPGDCYSQDCGGVFLIIHCLRKIHTPVDGAIPGQVVLSAMKVMAELVKRSKPGTNIPAPNLMLSAPLDDSGFRHLNGETNLSSHVAFGHGVSAQQ